jgi:selT/selW/selH-like putative selenoprotein
VDCRLIESSGGVYEVVVDGQLVYSKKATGQFPDELQLLEEIAAGR